jgi:hypothetical protein
VRYLYNNRSIANLYGNPYPGVGRTPEIAQPYSDLDLAVEKDANITERVGMKLYFNVFNVMNYRFLGTPDAFLTDANFGVNSYNSGYYGGNTGVASNGVPASRYIQLGGKVSF